jgi:hypothetical protein
MVRLMVRDIWCL